MAIVLTVTSYHRLSPDLQARRTVRDGAFTIGRDPGCDWALVDTEKLMSKRHATIARIGEGYQITDNSLNGTYLNDETAPIGRGLSRPLQDGDRLRLSDYEIGVTIEPDAACSASLPAWDVDEGPASCALPGEPAAAPGTGGFDCDRSESGLAVPSAASGAAGAQPLPPNAAFLDEDPESEPEPGEMPAWTPETERVALRPMRPVIPDNWQEEPDGGDAVDGSVSASPSAEVNPASVHVGADSGAFDASAPNGVAEPEQSPPVHAPPGGPIAGPGQLPSAPAPTASTAPPPPESPSQGCARSTGHVHDGMAAFLRGAGLRPEAVAAGDPDAALEDVGRLFATMVAGLTDVLATRSEVRNEFRLQQTVIRPRENNPLKFSATTEDALRALLTGERAGYMPPQRAVEEAVDDVKAHQIAVMAGVQGAVKGLLTRFDPESLQDRFGADRGVLGLGSGKARVWDAFVRLYADIAAEAEDDFHAVLGREFAKAYEACGRERARRP